MDKLSLQGFFNGEHDALSSSIDLFRKLLPHEKFHSSVHSGEEGRFIELALSKYLQEKLPSGIGVGGGFVVDIENEWNSKQIDILLYDKVNYAPLMKYGDAVVLPIQSIIGAISVKRKLHKKHLEKEISSLTEIGSRFGGKQRLKPYLSIIAFDYTKKSIPEAAREVFKEIEDFYSGREDVGSGIQYHSWNEMLDSVIVFDKFLIKGNNFTQKQLDEENTKKKQNTRLKPQSTNYIWTGGREIKRNIYIQHMLHGIHRAWYNNNRVVSTNEKLLAFPDLKMSSLGRINYCVLDRPYAWGRIKLLKPAITKKKTSNS